MTDPRSNDNVDDLIRKRRKIHARQSRKTTIRWIGIIIVVAALTIGLLNLVPNFFSQMEIMDKTYSPRDLERYKNLYKEFVGKTDTIPKELRDKLK